VAPEPVPGAPTTAAGARGVVPADAPLAISPGHGKSPHGRKYLSGYSADWVTNSLPGPL
jgi:hypothetical protein